MRTAVKRAVFGVLLIHLLVPGWSSTQTAVEAPEAFVERLQGFLRSGDFPSYLQAFEPGIRTAEETRLAARFDDLGTTGVSLRTAGIRSPAEGVARVSLQALFENDHAAVVETWTLALERGRAGWSVASLDVTGSVGRLYKILVPAERDARAGRVEVVHADIRFTFADAAVFYDNIPGLETALVVVGRGRVAFSPSDPNEKHQLKLLYKKDRIDDVVDSLYIRCSPAFFASNVRIEETEGLPAVTAAERDRAAAVFSRNYPRSYTIENSIDRRRLSFLPQGDEAVLEFKARKAGELAYIHYPASEDEVSLYDRGKERIICLYSPDREEGLPRKKMFVSFGEKFDITSYELDLSYSPAASYLSARARIEIVPQVDFLESLKFRFNPDLEILRIADEEGRELFYTQDRIREVLYAYFVSAPAAGTPTVIEVVYRGKMRPVPPSTDVVAQFGGESKILFKPRYETYFFSHAGSWYPGPMDEDYFQARLTLVVPPGYDCIANGEPEAGGPGEDLDEIVAAGKAEGQAYVFFSRSPLKYMSFIVGKFGRRKEHAGPVPVTTYVSSEVMDARPAVLDQAADILDFFGRSFGPFPYERLGIVLRLWPVSGGHSPASFIVINLLPWRGDPDYPAPADTPVDLSGREEYFLAHEIAHQWWGQGVSVDSYKDQWLSEGMSQFAAASYLRHRHGEAAFAAILKKFSRWTRKKSFRGPILMGSRLSLYDYEAYQAIVYDKAALALFMLQDLIGPEAFEAGLRSFFETHRFRAARTAAFVAAMESASGRDLEAFFTGWFSSWELPEVRTTWTETAVPGGVRLDFRVVQTADPFVFPLWIEGTVGGKAFREKIIVDEKVEEASLILPARPAKVRVNPERAVPGKFR
jgi:hypothetical protein